MPPKEFDRLWKTKAGLQKCRFAEIQKEIKKTIKKKTGLNQNIISKFLSCSPHFIGAYGQDEIDRIELKSFPVSVIVNTDNSYGSGHHWIFLFISKQYIEIFCPLGFNILKYESIPCTLLSFLNKHSRIKKIRIFRRTQSDTSVLCGYFCVMFALIRPLLSYSYLHSVFSSVAVSRKILLKFFR